MAEFPSFQELIEQQGAAVAAGQALDIEQQVTQAKVDAQAWISTSQEAQHYQYRVQQVQEEVGLVYDALRSQRTPKDVIFDVFVRAVRFNSNRRSNELIKGWLLTDNIHIDQPKSTGLHGYTVQEGYGIGKNGRLYRHHEGHNGTDRSIRTIRKGISTYRKVPAAPVTYSGSTMFIMPRAGVPYSLPDIRNALAYSVTLRQLRI